MTEVPSNNTTTTSQQESTPKFVLPQVQLKERLMNSVTYQKALSQYKQAQKVYNETRDLIYDSDGMVISTVKRLPKEKREVCFQLLKDAHKTYTNKFWVLSLLETENNHFVKEVCGILPERTPIESPEFTF